MLNEMENCRLLQQIPLESYQVMLNRLPTHFQLIRWVMKKFLPFLVCLTIAEMWFKHIVVRSFSMKAKTSNRMLRRIWFLGKKPQMENLIDLGQQNQIHKKNKIRNLNRVISNGKSIGSFLFNQQL